MPWPIVPAPSTAIRSIGRAAVLLFRSKFVINVLPKTWRTSKGGSGFDHGGAGACLGRLTCTALFILYASPKTPTEFRTQSVPRSGAVPTASYALLDRCLDQQWSAEGDQ